MPGPLQFPCSRYKPGNPTMERVPEKQVQPLLQTPGWRAQEQGRLWESFILWVLPSDMRTV
jgi:hypothetical protein